MDRAKGAGGRVGRYAVLWFLWLRMARKLFDPSHVPGDLGKSGLRNFGKFSFPFWKLFLGVLFGADPYCVLKVEPDFASKMLKVPARAKC